MGLKYSAAESAQLMQALSSNLQAAGRVSQRLSTGCRQLLAALESGQLQGAAYTAGRGLFSEIIVPAIGKLDGAIERVREELTAYQSADALVAPYGTLDWDCLTELRSKKQKQLEETRQLIAERKRFLKRASALMEGRAFDLWQETNALSYVEEQLEGQIKTLTKKIRALEDFNEQVAPYFSDSLEVFRLAIEGAIQLSQLALGADGHYDRQGLRMAAAIQLLAADDFQAKKEEVTKVACAVECFVSSQLKDRPQEEVSAVREQLKAQARVLVAEGWTASAVEKGYLGSLSLAASDQKQQLDAHFEAAHSIGSVVFNTMLTTAYSDDKEGAKASLKLVQELLGARVDEHQFLQLTNCRVSAADLTGSYHFSPNLDQAILFDNLFAGLVQTAYPKGIPKSPKKAADRELAQFTHQFRYWLDYKNNLALRASYPDQANDLERLKAYNQAEADKARAGVLDVPNRFVGEKARLHNKYPAGSDYQAHIAKYGENHKYVTASGGFHTEFIIDQAGNLVSQWNTYRFTLDGTVLSDPAHYQDLSIEQQMQLINGNSVNYSEDSEKIKKSVFSINPHNILDSRIVATYDPELRKKIVKEWEEPSTKVENKDYFDRVKSEHEANKRLENRP